MLVEMIIWLLYKIVFKMSGVKWNKNIKLQIERSIEVFKTVIVMYLDYKW